MEAKLLLFLVQLVAVTRSQSGVDVVFNGVVYENNSEIYITNVGEGSFALSCRTSLTGCCKSPPVGEWYYPDGQIVNVRRFEEDYYRNRDEEGNVYLNRRNSPQLPRGIYRCTLPDQNGLMVTLHVGLYIQEDYSSFTKQPESQREVIPGSNVTFSTETKQATSFSWYFESAAISPSSQNHVGASTDTLTVLNATSEDQGFYQCVASTTYLSTYSSFAELTLTSIPILVVHAEDVLNASPGSTVSFLVFSFDLSAEYRWVRSDGISLSDSRFSGVNLGNLVISDVRPSDAGTYMCIVSNPAGSVISSARLTLKVKAPVLVTPAKDVLNVSLGDNVTISVVVSGYDIMYLWELESGEFLPSSDSRYVGVRLPTLTIADVRTSDVGVFVCTATNSGGSVMSSAELSILLQIPMIEKEAEDIVNASLGSNVTFSVLASGGALTYVWKKGIEMLLLMSNDRISGVLTNQLTVTDVDLEDVGVYVCIVSNTAGVAMTNASLMIVLDAPQITVPPTDALNLTFGSTVTFTLEADGLLLEYQWQRDDGISLLHDRRFSGVNTDSMEIRDVELGDAGMYECVVSNSGGSVSSKVELSIVLDVPMISRRADTANMSFGSDVVFMIEASGHLLEYIWQKQDGTSLLQNDRITGARTDMMVIRDVQLSDEGIYVVTVSNIAGIAQSSVALTIVLEAPRIAVSAEDALNVTVGSNVTFVIRASGDLLEYLWEGPGERSLLQSPRFSGVKTSVLVIGSIQLSDAGSYVCVVSNREGSDRSTVVLTVVSVPSSIKFVSATPLITSATISWTFLNISTHPVQFEVQYYPVLFPYSVILLTTLTLSTTLTGLVPRLQYRVRVRESNESSWMSRTFKLEQKIPPVENFSVEMVNGSYVRISWSPIELEGWNVSHYSLVYQASNSSSTEPPFSRKYELDGHSISKSLHPADLFVETSLWHVFELSAVLRVYGLEGMGAVTGEVARANKTFNYKEVPFQFLFGPIDYCVTWGVEKADHIRSTLRAAVTDAMSARCNCSFPDETLGKDFFSCRTSTTTAIYRGTLTGYYSELLMGCVEDWASSNKTVLLDWFLVDVLASCPVRISSHHENDCI